MSQDIKRKEGGNGKSARVKLLVILPNEKMTQRRYFQEKIIYIHITYEDKPEKLI